MVASTSAESDSRLNKLALRMKRRKTVSVTPAIGASIVAGATGMPPIETHAGTRALAGIACSIGLSQFFFMVLAARQLLRAAASVGRGVIASTVKSLRVGGGFRNSRGLPTYFAAGSALAYLRRK